MKRIENRRNLAIFIAILAISLLACVANIVKLNVFALVIDMILVIFVCFLLGYNYCRYEENEQTETTDTEIVTEEVQVPTEETLSDAIKRIQSQI